MSEIDDLEEIETRAHCDPATVHLRRNMEKARRASAERMAIKRKHMRYDHRPPSDEPSLPKFKCLDEN